MADTQRTLMLYTFNVNLHCVLLTITMFQASSIQTAVHTSTGWWCMFKWSRL